jgi:hypothetical protein
MKQAEFLDMFSIKTKRENEYWAMADFSIKIPFVDPRPHTRNPRIKFACQGMLL